MKAKQKHLGRRICQFLSYYTPAEDLHWGSSASRTPPASVGQDGIHQNKVSMSHIHPQSRPDTSSQSRHFLHHRGRGRGTARSEKGGCLLPEKSTRTPWELIGQQPKKSTKKKGLGFGRNRDILGMKGTQFRRDFDLNPLGRKMVVIGQVSLSC